MLNSKYNKKKFLAKHKSSFFTSKFVTCPGTKKLNHITFSCLVLEQLSWCKSEMVVDSPKNISVPTSKSLLEIPAVVVAAINLKTTINPKHNINEIVSTSVICCYKAKIDGPMVASEWKHHYLIDGPMVASEWKRRGTLTHFTVVRKLEGGIFPMGLTKEVSDSNSKAGTNVLALESRISFGMGVVMLSTASSMNYEQSYGAGCMDGDCYIVKNALYVGAAALAILTALLSIRLYMVIVKSLLCKEVFFK